MGIVYEDGNTCLLSVGGPVSCTLLDLKVIIIFVVNPLEIFFQKGQLHTIGHLGHFLLHFFDILTSLVT